MVTYPSRVPHIGRARAQTPTILQRVYIVFYMFGIVCGDLKVHTEAAHRWRGGTAAN